MKKLILFLFALLSVLPIRSESSKKTYVLLVSFDAFRHDYVKKFDTPNFNQLMSSGMYANSMISTYPSKTFANHYSIITGVHAGNNGLVDNVFYDPDLKLLYSSKNHAMVENPAFYGALPLWQLAEQNGMKSASFFWPGSETKIAGSYPTYWKGYDASVPNEARIDTVMHWFNLPEDQRPRFISLYFSLTDDMGHRYGPYSKEVGNAVEEADRLVGVIMNDIKKTNLDINLVIVSDHGMVEVKPEGKYLLTEEKLYAGLDSTKYTAVNDGTHVRFYCNDKTYKETLYKTLNGKKDHLKVYKREDTPLRWHVRNNDREGDVLVVLKPGYDVVSQKIKQDILKRGGSIGTHGYDPKTKDVQGIFYAWGPQIPSGKKISSFENVNVYPFVAELLGIHNLPKIDGKKDVLDKYIQK